MTTARIVHVDCGLVDLNPWQTRSIYADRVDRLAASIKEHGLIHRPLARVHPEKSERFQLAVGHHRFRAWQKACPGQPIPLDLVELTDQQMAEYAIVENDERDELSGVEKARALQVFIDEFHVTQAEAGKLFGLKTPGAVSNLLRLLSLPSLVQGMVDKRELAEYVARELVPVALCSKAQCENMAKAAVKCDIPDRLVKVRKLRHEWARRNGEVLQQSEDFWPLTWPGSPISTEMLRRVDGSTTIPKCDGCEFCLFLDKYAGHYCLRPPCYQAKRVAWARWEVDRVSKKLGLPVATPDDKTTVVFDGDSNGVDFARACLASKHASLRLVVADDEKGGYSSVYERRDVLGSRWATLASVDAAALRVQVKVKSVAGTGCRVDPKRAARERMVRESRRVVRVGSVYLSSALPESEPVLDLLFSAVFVSNDLRKKWKTLDAAAKRQALALEVANRAIPVSEWGGGSVASVRKQVVDLAHSLRVKLPSGWDKEQEHDKADKRGRKAVAGKAGASKKVSSRRRK